MRWCLAQGNQIKIPIHSLSNVRAVVFDVFGTLAEIGDKRRPFARLVRQIRTTSMKRSAGAALLMSSNVDLAGAPALFDGQLPVEDINRLELDLQAELASIKLYPEVTSTLIALRKAGYKIGLCSNLAAPYAAPIKQLLPFELDAYAWSFEVGAVKPDTHIYENVCHSLKCSPSEVIMIGDTLEEDCVAPQRFGMHGFFLDRKGARSVDGSLSGLDKILGMLGIG